MGPKPKAYVPTILKEDNSILKCGVLNNLPAWMLVIKGDARREFGFLGTMCDRGIEYTVPPVELIDYMPEEGPLEDGEEAVPLSAAAISRVREGAIVARNKKVRFYNDEKPKFFSYLWNKMSPDSAVQIAAHEDFDAAFDTSDPFMLWTIIMYTHLTHVNGDAPEMRDLTMAEEEDRHSLLRQGKNETIGDFLLKLKNSYIVLVAAGIPEYTEQKKAIQFLNKLDQARHGIMYADMKNRARRGEALPATLFAAYTLASHWLVKKSTGVFGFENHSVFLADEGRGRGGKGGKPGKVKASNKSIKTPDEKWVEMRRCYNCGENGHISKD